MWCDDKVRYGKNGKKHLMGHCVTDKHLEGLKVGVTNYQTGVVGPLILDKKKKKTRIELWGGR